MADVVTIEEFARRLEISLETARRWARKGQIRALRVGRQYRIPRAELERVLAEGVDLSQQAKPVRNSEGPLFDVPDDL